MRGILAVLLMFMPVTRLGAAEPFLLQDGQRVVFLGDSNTFAGKFIAYLDAYLCTRFPDKRFELINLGLPSETVSGLSEPDHPYPRPNIHDRVDRALALTRPHLVVIGYGMNDGIYYPFSKDRFQKYQDGITKLIAKVEKAGAKAMLLSPVPFGAGALKGKVLAAGAEKYSWMRPYERYDEEVLAKYAEWLATWREKKYVVIDAHAAVRKHLEVMRKDDPAYRISGDGIHPNANGHLVIALEFLKEWRAPARHDIAIDVTQDPPTRSDVKITFVRRNYVAFTCSLPVLMPADPDWTAKVRDSEKFDAKINGATLKVDGLGGFLTIRVGKGKKGILRVQTRGDEIAKGLDLADVLKQPADTKGPDIWKRVAEKNRLLGLAWLSHVGHKRPDTPKGLPIDEALKKVAALDAEIRQLCQPAEIYLGIGPVGK